MSILDENYKGAFSNNMMEIEKNDKVFFEVKCPTRDRGLVPIYEVSASGGGAFISSILYSKLSPIFFKMDERTIETSFMLVDLLKYLHILIADYSVYAELFIGNGYLNEMLSYVNFLKKLYKLGIKEVTDELLIGDNVVCNTKAKGKKNKETCKAVIKDEVENLTSDFKKYLSRLKIYVKGISALMKDKRMVDFLKNYYTLKSPCKDLVLFINNLLDPFIDEIDKRPDMNNLEYHFKRSRDRPEDYIYG